MAAMPFVDPRESPHSEAPPALVLAVPPGLFGISFGLLGLAGVWRLAARSTHLPLTFSTVLFAAAATVFLGLLIGWLIQSLVEPHVLAEALANPIIGPFHALLPLNGMLLGVGLATFDLTAARWLFALSFGVMVLFGGWITGQWIAQPQDEAAIHPGYLLPTVAGGFLGADSAAKLGWFGLGWLSFGIGLVCWFVLSSVVLHRLFFKPTLPGALIPTLAIELTPPIVAGNAYVSLTSNPVSVVSMMLAGYVVLLGVVQLRLVGAAWGGGTGCCVRW